MSKPKPRSNSDTSVTNLKSKDVYTALRRLIQQFIDDLMNVNVNDTELFDLRMYVMTELTNSKLIAYLEQNILPLKDKILKKEEEDVLQHIFFKMRDNQMLQRYTKLWMGGSINQNEKTVVWSYLQCIVKVIDNYKQKETE